MKMINLYSPQNEPDLAFLKSILDAEDINYFVRNDNFGSMKIGPQIELYNKKMIVVQEDQFQRARELIDDYLKSTRQEKQEINVDYSLFDRIRMAVEVLLFGWMMPGKKRRKKSD